MIIIEADSRPALEKIASNVATKTFKKAFVRLWTVARDTKADVEEARLAMRALASRGIYVGNEEAMAGLLVKTAQFGEISDWWSGVKDMWKGTGEAMERGREMAAHRRLLGQAIESLQALFQQGLLFDEERAVVTKMLSALRQLQKQTAKARSWQARQPAFRFRQPQQTKQQQPQAQQPRAPQAKPQARPGPARTMAPPAAPAATPVPAPA